MPVFKKMNELFHAVIIDAGAPRLVEMKVFAFAGFAEPQRGVFKRA